MPLRVGLWTIATATSTGTIAVGLAGIAFIVFVGIATARIVRKVI